MSEIIKQLGVYNNELWTKVGIGTDADKVDLESTILGQNNVQGTLNAAFGAGELTPQKVVITNAQRQLTTSNLNANDLKYLSNTKENIQNQIDNIQLKINNINTSKISVIPPIAGKDNLQNLLRSIVSTTGNLESGKIVIVDQDGKLTTDYPLNYRVGGPVYRTSNIDLIIEPSTNNAIVTAASYAQTGQVAQLYIKWQNKNDISVQPHGDIVNILVGTLTSDKKPAIFTGAWSRGDLSGKQAWYNISDVSGGIGLSAVEGYGTTVRTIQAGSDFELLTTYIVMPAV